MKRKEAAIRGAERQAMMARAAHCLDRLADLHRQATEERSHYYAADVIRESIAVIVELMQKRTKDQSNG